jgi:hypothetical protein
MGWMGYFEYAGNEIINGPRVEAYARHLSWFKKYFKNPVLAPMLGHRPYQSPLVDDAPWTDPDDEASYDFLGVYPLSVDGLENSSRSSVVTESLGDGGTPGRVRHGTKQPVFNVALIANSEAGAEYGMKWLRRATLGAGCGPNATDDCFGAALCYLSSEPQADLQSVPRGSTAAVLSGGNADTDADIVVSGGDAFSDAGTAITRPWSDPEAWDGGESWTTFSTDTFDPDHLGDTTMSGGDASSVPGLLSRTTSLFNVTTYAGDDPVNCLPPYLRSLRQVVFNTGPTLTAKHSLRGGEAWIVTFTGVAGNPAELGPELEVVTGFLDPNVANPWAGGLTPEGGIIDLDGFMLSDESPCDPITPTPIYDPLHPAIILPPGAPSVPLGFFTPPVNWRRRQFTIPKQYVPAWGEVVPKIAVHARDDDVRSLRLRFYADPYLIGDISDDPCAFCGDIILSYIPQGATMTLDGAEETVTVLSDGVVRRADSLVFSSDGTPFTWPRLTCGFGYVVTVDLAEQDPPPVIDLSLFERII